MGAMYLGFLIDGGYIVNPVVQSLFCRNWRDFAFADYRGPNLSDPDLGRTFFGRQRVVNDLIEPHIRNMPSDLRCLIIGVGRAGYESDLQSSYFPPSILEHATLFRELGKDDFSITAFDVVPEHLRPISEASSILLETNDGTLEDVLDRHEAYLETLLDQESLNKPEDPDLSSMVNKVSRLNFTAGLPAWLLEKRNQGAIRAIVGDVVTYPLASLGQFDLVICMNVLPYLGREEDPSNAELPEKAFMIALRNITGAMKSDAILATNQESQSYWHPRFPHFFPGFGPSPVERTDLEIFSQKFYGGWRDDNRYLLCRKTQHK